MPSPLRPSELLAALLDVHTGSWTIEAAGHRPLRRAYLGASGVLETVLSANDAEWTITDFMPVGQIIPSRRLPSLFRRPRRASESADLI